MSVICSAFPFYSDFRVFDIFFCILISPFKLFLATLSEDGTVKELNAKWKARSGNWGLDVSALHLLGSWLVQQWALVQEKNSHQGQSLPNLLVLQQQFSFKQVKLNCIWGEIISFVANVKSACFLNFLEAVPVILSDALIALCLTHFVWKFLK